MVQKICTGIERLFLPIAICFSALGLIEPAVFAWMKPHIPKALGLIMFGMGLTLELSDFRKVADRWRLVVLGAVLQYTVMPLLAVGVSLLFGLPLEVAVGLALVGACPGGTASNVIVYLARGNVALSVTMTLVSTSLAPLLTPAIVYALYSARIDINFWGMVKNVFWIVVFPLIDGLVIRRLLREHVRPLLTVFPSISIITIAAVIACVVALNQNTILSFPLLIIGAVIVHNLCGFGFGYGAARLCKADKRDARTMAIEVGMQNSGLGVALAHAHFSALAALPGAIFSLEQNLAGVVLSRHWVKKDEREKEGHIAGVVNPAE